MNKYKEEVMRKFKKGAKIDSFDKVSEIYGFARKKSHIWNRGTIHFCNCGAKLELTGFDNYKCPNCGIIEMMPFPPKLIKFYKRRHLDLDLTVCSGGIEDETIDYSLLYLYKIKDELYFEVVGDDDTNSTYFLSFSDVLREDCSYASDVCKEYLREWIVYHTNDKEVPSAICWWDIEEEMNLNSKDEPDIPNTVILSKFEDGKEITYSELLSMFPKKHYLYDIIASLPKISPWEIDGIYRYKVNVSHLDEDKISIFITPIYCLGDEVSLLIEYNSLDIISIAILNPNRSGLDGEI